jgi:hypothetical protein
MGLQYESVHWVVPIYEQKPDLKQKYVATVPFMKVYFGFGSNIVKFL